jgi:hypothetical protein
LAVPRAVYHHLKIESIGLAHFTVRECGSRCRSTATVRVVSAGKATESCKDASMASGQPGGRTEADHQMRSNRCGPIDRVEATFNVLNHPFQFFSIFSMLIWSDRNIQSTINTLLNMSSFNHLNHSQHEKIDFLHFGRLRHLWTVNFIINSQNFTFLSTFNVLNHPSQFFSIFSILIWSDINFQSPIGTLFNISIFNLINQSHHEKIKFLSDY